MDEKEFERAAPAWRQRAVAESQRQGATSAEAEDIAQDTMVRMWQLREELHDDDNTPLAVVIARRLTLSMLRRRRSVPLPPSSEQLADGTTPDRDLEDKENIRWLEQRLSRLPSTEHAILYMRQVERRDNREIAQRLGIEESSVSTLLARARRKLLEEFKRRR